MLSNGLLKNPHLSFRRTHGPEQVDRLTAPSKIEGRRGRTALPSPLVFASRSILRDALLGISGALCLSVFEQPAIRVFFSILLSQGLGFLACSTTFPRLSSRSDGEKASTDTGLRP